ncbi:MAG: MaoC family dehydratase N-terminal domain-containing protein, partial [Spongiibacteraceae bacterium]
LFAIQYYCAAMQDPNPAYWDEKFATDYFGGFTAPPAMLQSWTVPLPWHPHGAPGLNSISIMVPLPGDRPINVSNDIEYFRPLYVGDIVSYFDQLMDVSEEKTTRVGTGHFITSVGEYRNQNDQLIARSTNILFRYRAHDA